MSSKRILVVDDDRQCATLVRNILEAAGFEAEEAYSGGAALRRLSQDLFDMALIDFDMRDIKGDRICLMLRMEDRYKDLPIMIITAHVEKEEQVFKEYGATDVVYKPLDSEEFIGKVRKCLNDR